MKNTLSRSAAAALLFASLATPAFAQGGDHENKGNGRGWGHIMASFRLDKKELMKEWKEAKKEWKEARKEDRKEDRKPTQDESNLCLKDAKQNRETAITAARKSHHDALEAAKAANRTSLSVAMNVRLGAFTAAQNAYLASDKGLIARITLATSKAKAMSDWRVASSAAKTVLLEANVAAQKAFDAAKVKIEADFKVAIDKCVTVATDTTAPSAISTLVLSGATASSLTVSWTATGDDGATGTAASYDLRYSTAPITDANFASATQVTGEPAAAVSGTSRTMTVSGLTANTTYHFAIKSSDEANNVSALSNVASMTTLAVAADTMAPGAVTNLSVSGVTQSSAMLSWTAPGDDGVSGTAASYDVRYSTAAITDANFASATQVTGEPAPTVAGTTQSVGVSALSANTNYFFAIKATDEAANASALSNVPSVTTLP